VIVGGSRPRNGRARSLPWLFAMIGIAVAGLLPFFALLLRSRGLRADQIGLVLATLALANLVVGPIWGHVADTRSGRIRAIRTAALASIAAGVGYAFLAHGFWLLLLGAALLSSAWAPVVPFGDALAVVRLGERALVEYGGIRLWSSIGYAVAIVAFGAALEVIDLTAVLVFFACAAGAIAVWAFRQSPDPAEHIAQSRLGAAGDVIREAPRLAPFLGAVLLVGIGTTAAWQFLPLRIVGGGGGPFLVGVAGALGAGMEVPVMRSTSRLTDRWSLRAVYAFGCVAYVLVFVIWSLADNALLVSVLGALEGVGFALTYTSVVIIVGRLVPERLQATGQAVRSMIVTGLAPIVGAFGGGIIYAKVGPGALFTCSAGLVVAGVAIVWPTLSAPAFSKRAFRFEVGPTEAIPPPLGSGSVPPPEG
jgi:MFS transporter, PPP family, 3-phenylpropionic acid transporter